MIKLGRKLYLCLGGREKCSLLTVLLGLYKKSWIFSFWNSNRKKKKKKSFGSLATSPAAPLACRITADHEMRMTKAEIIALEVPAFGIRVPCLVCPCWHRSMAGPAQHGMLKEMVWRLIVLGQPKNLVEVVVQRVLQICTPTVMVHIAISNAVISLPFVVWLYW